MPDCRLFEVDCIDRATICEVGAAGTARHGGVAAEELPAGYFKTEIRLRRTLDESFRKLPAAYGALKFYGIVRQCWRVRHRADDKLRLLGRLLCG